MSQSFWDSVRAFRNSLAQARLVTLELLEEQVVPVLRVGDAALEVPWYERLGFQKGMGAPVPAGVPVVCIELVALSVSSCPSTRATPDRTL
jgi:hypothetical protein